MAVVDKAIKHEAQVGHGTVSRRGSVTGARRPDTSMQVAGPPLQVNLRFPQTPKLPPQIGRTMGEMLAS